MAGYIPPTVPPPPSVGPQMQSMRPAPPSNSGAGKWIIGGAVLLGVMIVASIVYVVFRVVGVARGEYAQHKIAEEYLSYYEGDAGIPDEPMFPNASLPIELLGNRTRAMLRELFAVQKEVKLAEKDHYDNGVWSFSAYTSKTEYNNALKRVDRMVSAYKRMAELHARVPEEYLPDILSVVAGTPDESFYRMQEEFHLAETDVKKEEAKIASEIGAVLRERAKLCWKYRKYLRKGRDGVAELKPTAPTDFRARLDVIDSLIETKYDEWNDASRDLNAAFNRFYYTVTGQRQDDFSGGE